MPLDLYVPIAAAVLLGLTAPALARLLPPAAGMRVLVGAGVGCAFGWVWALGLLAWTGLAQAPFFADLGGWSVTVLRDGDPVPAAGAYAATALLLAVAAGFCVTATRRISAVWRTWQWERRIGLCGPELVVLPNPDAHAYALPAVTRRGGHIVVTAGMLRALDAEERRVLFAHERAHLSGGHHWWLLAAQLSAGANPLLVRLPAAVDYLLERIADETAAVAVGDRRLAARALARAGLATRGWPPPAASGPGVAPAYSTSAVQARIAALLGSPPPARRWLLTTVVLAVTIAMLAGLDAGHDVEQLFELAIAAR